jgi:hypothetical protein
MPTAGVTDPGADQQCKNSSENKNKLLVHVSSSKLGGDYIPATLRMSSRVEEEAVVR